MGVEARAWGRRIRQGKLGRSISFGIMGAERHAVHMLGLNLNEMWLWPPYKKRGKLHTSPEPLRSWGCVFSKLLILGLSAAPPKGQSTSFQKSLCCKDSAAAQGSREPLRHTGPKSARN